MADWTKSMQQTFEYYTVDPDTWKDVDLLTNVKSCTIDRDLEAETLGSATIDVTETVGECYIRVYLKTIQNGITEKHPLGTFLVQTPSSPFNGKVRNVSMDCYTPLLEAKEKQPSLGYSILKGANIMDNVFQLVDEAVRAPVVPATCDKTLHDDFVANEQDTWLIFNADLMANANYRFDLDELGRVLFAPNQKIESLQPVWTYTDDNSSILYSDVTTEHDLYGIPNVVEVLYSSGNTTYYAKVVNDDPDSPTSTIRRGREITYRINNPDLYGEPDQDQIDEYAIRVMKELSSVEYSVSYKHAYCPVRIGDCVRINYERAGLFDVKAKVISQSITCKPGCPVSEKAVFTVKLWG